MTARALGVPKRALLSPLWTADQNWHDRKADDSMLTLDIPGRARLQLTHLLLDLNGTLTVDGQLLPSVEDQLRDLKPQLDCQLFSADTNGTLTDVAARLGVSGVRVQSGAEKRAAVDALGPGVVAVGNGYNDTQMFSRAALSIVVIGPEGSSVKALMAADIVTSCIGDALDLLRFPTRLVATLRE